MSWLDFTAKGQISAEVIKKVTYDFDGFFGLVVGDEALNEISATSGQLQCGSALQEPIKPEHGALTDLIPDPVVHIVCAVTKTLQGHNQKPVLLFCKVLGLCLIVCDLELLEWLAMALDDSSQLVLDIRLLLELALTLLDCSNDTLVIYTSQCTYVSVAVRRIITVKTFSEHCHLKCMVALPAISV